ncbi:hypothetical protein MNB_SV-6-1712 [hydrothermal vent metagenome]|uniref:Uncharacterized protein n=1 Tax=hydrothermal vent metagenome TaxID=652676 RepID=A0A1W1C5K5_9ZZZZ
MKRAIYYLLVMIFGVSNANAKSEIGSYTLPITRHNITHSMVAYNFWSGEYPKPVIYVKPTHGRWSKISGYSSLRRANKREECTIKSGIYHPWSRDSISLINYYSIVPKIDYIAREDRYLEGLHIKRGSKLENELYLAEGSCRYLLNKKREIITTCIEDSSTFERIKRASHPREQWLYLKCREGNKIFVQDNDLLSQPNVTRGAISGYGKVTAPK